MSAYGRISQGPIETTPLRQHGNYSRAWIPFDEGWRLLSDQFDTLTLSLKDGSGPAKLPIIPAYSMVYDLAQQGHTFSKELYSRIEPMLISWFDGDLLQRYRFGSPLHRFSKMYEEFLIVHKYMCAVFQYLDQFHVKRDQCLTIIQLTISCFYSNVFKVLQSEIYQAVESDISKSRMEFIEKGKSYDGDVSVLRALTEAVLQFKFQSENATFSYDVFLSEPIVVWTRKFYSNDFSKNMISTMGTCQYLQQVSKIIANEVSFFQCWLTTETVNDIRTRLQDSLLLKPFSVLIMNDHDGFNSMLSNRSLSDLSLVYTLYHNQPSSLESLATLYQSHVTDKGRLLVAKAVSFLADLIAFRVQELHLIQTVFSNSIRFHRALHDALESVLEASNNSAQMMSTYLDNMLIKCPNDQEIANVVALVCCLRQDKDVFALHYRNGLANRLLSYSRDPNSGDNNVVRQFRAILGSGYTHQMEVMLADIQKQNALSASCGQIDFTGRILTMGSWPKSLQDSEKALIVPPIINDGLNIIETSYKNATAGRKIVWIHSAANCIIYGKCLRSQPDLHVSSIQALILLIFNHRDKVVIKDLPALTGMSLPMIKRALRHMCTGKSQILLKEPTQGYSTNDFLSVNTKFSSAERQIRINLGAEVAVNDHELKQSVATLKEDRKHIIEACTVRLLKHNKTMMITDLKLSVIAKIKECFQADAGLVMDTIMDLVTREYICRDPLQPELLRYNPE